MYKQLKDNEENVDKPIDTPLDRPTPATVKDRPVYSKRKRFKCEIIEMIKFEKI